MKKNIITFAIVLIVFSLSLSAMAELNVVTTIFPVYDWVREISGDADGVDTTMLLDSGVDLHSYQPTAADIMKVANCDVFIYVGGESDEWVEDALETSVNPDMVVVNLMEALRDDVREEEMVEGMEPEEEEHGEGEHEEGEHEEGEEVEYDEHVWLSLRNAQKLVKALAAALGGADPDHADAYAANADAYIAKLEALDGEYAAARAEAGFDTVLFGDRFPFRYMVDDYGLNYYAAFLGCSAETEASFETVAFLSGKVDELGLPAVLTIEGTDHRIAETIVANTQSKSPQVLAMNSMQGVTAGDVEGGAKYIDIMAANLDVLKQALTK